MFRPRIIPSLLLLEDGLVKTIQFGNPTYIGDPINAVRLFNDFRADELVFLDITASRENRTINPDLVRRISEAAFMPFSVGGGIRTLKDAEALIASGAEKVVITTAFSRSPEVVEEIANKFGSQAVVVGIDVRKNREGFYEARTKSGTEAASRPLKEYVKYAQSMGAGEILIQSIDRDGTMQGYDNELIQEVSSLASIPVIALGGAGRFSDFNEAIRSGASAASAGSVFVFHGPKKAVLIQYPSKEERARIFS